MTDTILTEGELDAEIEFYHNIEGVDLIYIYNAETGEPLYVWVGEDEEEDA